MYVDAVTNVAPVSPNSDGVDFLGNQPGLRRGCFLAMDAVKWMMENVKRVKTRKEAVEILQVLYTHVLKCTGAL